MKTRIIILIVLLIYVLATSFIFSQESKQRFVMGTAAGYEYNYFKSPTEVRQDTILFTEDDLISSSSYEDIYADYNYRIKWKGNRLRLSASPNARLFYDNFDDSYWSLNVNAKYDREIGKSTEFLAQLSFKRMNREGLDGAQDVLVNPLGYTNYGVRTGLEIRPIKKNKTTLMAFYNFKDFDAFGIRDLQFNEFGLQVNTKQQFRVNRLRHSYGINSYIKKRLYDTFNASDVITSGERDWSYVKATAFYELPITKNLDIEPSYTYYARIDNMDKRSGFTQTGPSLGIDFNNDVTRVRSSLKYLTRNYTTLEARDNNGSIGEKIKYQYMDISLNAEHLIGKNGFALTAEAYSRVRTTNYTDIDARSFRGYTNQYAGIGIRWEL
ncbi:hypothetical protein LV716_03015 [Flagellimonas sp. HMM57]|uniref:hypothetical protein n=1 Tax=unclassified Flagellimonas TaxID=2644544 RepID=UPI0013D26866|nr:MULTISPECIES: hypothetical protein [unclassified Flagellimonas]UII76777.1 hypothetical protein LV716_03015 [Flagellimonas sp. HMM57]